MPDHLAELSELARERVSAGYYDTATAIRRRRKSLIQAVRASRKTPIIAEIKYASPSSGKIRDYEPAVRIAKEMLTGGACALSIITDPVSFQGGLNILSEVAQSVIAPLIMKDIIVSPRQLRAAARFGADTVVLISELFTAGLTDVDIITMMQEARGLGLEVIVEANSPSEFEKMRAFQPDIYGINNRNLSSFQVDLDTTARILADAKPVSGPVVSESGIETVADIKRLKTAGAQAFLIGTCIMKCSNVEQKVRELVNS